MKQLYIRKGNSLQTKDILIVGGESSLGSRDTSGYKASKGSTFKSIRHKDPYTGNTNLTYIHATPNIKLNTQAYANDHEVHKFIKKYCKDIVKWDGECEEGRVRSREAFICIKGNPDRTASELYRRLELEIHGKKIKAPRLLPIRRFFISFIKWIIWVLLPLLIYYFVINYYFKRYV